MDFFLFLHFETLIRHSAKKNSRRELYAARHTQPPSIDLLTTMTENLRLSMTEVQNLIDVDLAFLIEEKVYKPPKQNMIRLPKSPQLLKVSLYLKCHGTRPLD